MGVVTPLALSLAALSIPIVALYLLKIRRREHIVSSTLLWDRIERDLEANQPWQKFRPNWLLLLQLLALIALVVALARPFLSVEAALGASTVVVIDTSASMGARDGDQTRLDAAKDQIRDLIDRMPSDGEMLLVAAGAQARVVQPMTDDRSALRSALDRIQPEAGQAAIADALALANAAASRLPDAQVVIASDGDVPATALVTVTVPVRTMQVGSVDPQNLAIITMAVGRGASAAELFVRILNAGPSERATRITLFDDQTGTLIAAQDIAIPAASSTALTFPDLPADTTVVRAELSYQGPDALAVDDIAWARTRGGDRAKVLLVTTGNLFLERALALLPDLDVSLGAADGGAPPGYDLYVFDGVAPPAGLRAPLLTINPPSGNPIAEVIGSLEQPGITGFRSDDPILSGVDLSQTHLAVASQLTTPTWATPLIISGEDPLLLAGLKDGLRTAVLAFDVHQSDLPLQTAFPILIANLTGWLLPDTTPAAPLAASPGQLVPLHPRTGADHVELIGPDGKPKSIPAEPEILFSATSQPGSYLLRDMAGDTELRTAGFVVNLLSAEESDLAPTQDQAQPNDDGSQDGTVGSLVGDNDDLARHFIWWPAVAVGVTFLAIEWWAFYRGRRLPRLTRASLRLRRPSLMRRPHV